MVVKEAGDFVQVPESRSRSPCGFSSRFENLDIALLLVAKECCPSPLNGLASQNLTFHMQAYFFFETGSIWGLKFVVPQTYHNNFLNKWHFQLSDLISFRRESWGKIGNTASSGVIESFNLQMEFPFWPFLAQPLQHKLWMTKLKPLRLTQANCWILCSSKS